MDSASLLVRFTQRKATADNDFNFRPVDLFQAEYTTTGLTGLLISVVGLYKGLNLSGTNRRIPTVIY